LRFDKGEEKNDLKFIGYNYDTKNYKTFDELKDAIIKKCPKCQAINFGIFNYYPRINFTDLYAVLENKSTIGGGLFTSEKVNLHKDLPFWKNMIIPSYSCKIAESVRPCKESMVLQTTTSEQILSRAFTKSARARSSIQSRAIPKSERSSIQSRAIPKSSTTRRFRRI
jgi:hypothetical protein